MAVKKKVCSKCGATNKLIAEKCQNCGAPLTVGGKVKSLMSKILGAAFIAFIIYIIFTAER